MKVNGLFAAFINSKPFSLAAEIVINGHQPSIVFLSEVVNLYAPFMAAYGILQIL